MKPARIRPVMFFTLAMAFLKLTSFVDSAMAKGKGCNTVVEVGSISLALDVFGPGFASFPPGAPKNPDQLATAKLLWDYNLFYARHPDLGLVSIMARAPESQTTLTSVSGTPPLFPANSVHELYFDMRVERLHLDLTSATPVRLVSDQPVPDLKALNSHYTLNGTVSFYDKPDSGSNPVTLSERPKASVSPAPRPSLRLLSGNAQVVDLLGFDIDLLGISPQGGAYRFDFRITNQSGASREVVWNVAKSGNVNLLSPTGDHRMLGNSHLATIGGQPLTVSVIASFASKRPEDRLFLGVSTLDGSRLGADLVVEGSALTALPTQGGEPAV